MKNVLGYVSQIFTAEKNYSTFTLASAKETSTEPDDNRKLDLLACKGDQTCNGWSD